MKSKLVSNLGLKIISILFALILWLIVVNVDDPMTTKKFKDIPVTILNETLLEQQGQVYQVLDNSNVISVTVKAKRSVIESLSSSDFYATADFSERISTNSIPIKISATKSADKISDIELLNNTVKISIEARTTKDIPVVLQLNGAPADGFTVGTTSINPSTITISGPDSEISQVAKVVLQADVTGVNKDFETIVTGNLCNANGEAIDESRLDKSVEQYQVKVELLHTKSVDLDFKVSGDAADGYRYTDMEYSPTTIGIAGDEQTLANISTLEIPAEELNITGLTGNVTKIVDVSKYLPTGLRLASNEDKNIKVLLKIEQLGSKTFTIPVSSIDVLNTPSGLDVSFDSTNSISVTVQGQGNQLDSLKDSDVQVTVDLKGKTEGSYTLDTNVKVPDGYSVSTKSTVRVVLKARTGTEPPANGGATQDTVQNQVTVATNQPTEIHQNSNE